MFYMLRIFCDYLCKTCCVVLDYSFGYLYQTCTEQAISGLNCVINASYALIGQNILSSGFSVGIKSVICMNLQNFKFSSLIQDLYFCKL